MEENSTKTQADSTTLFAGDAWFDPAANASRFGEIEASIRDWGRGFTEELLKQELTAALGRTRHERAESEPKGYRNGTRERQLLGSFGPVELSVPRARLATEGGGTQEWRSATLPRYARMTRQVEALIASAYLSGTDTRRVTPGAGRVVWRCGGQGRGQPYMAQGQNGLGRLEQARSGWGRYRPLDPGETGGLRRDGTVVRVRLDRKATNISLLGWARPPCLLWVDVDDLGIILVWRDF